MKGYGLEGLRWTWRKKKTRRRCSLDLAFDGLGEKNPKTLLVGLVTEVNEEVGQELVRQHGRWEKRCGGAAGDGGGAPYSSFRSPVAGSCLPGSDNRHAGAWRAAGEACRRHARGGRRGDQFSGEGDVGKAPEAHWDATAAPASRRQEYPKMLRILVELQKKVKELLAWLESRNMKKKRPRDLICKWVHG
ncbi:hypothetical protein VPH35_082186 [Triticum aestivum]